MQAERARKNFSVSRRMRRAFTLIELLLVMVILAVLAGIVLPKFTKRGEDAKISAAKASISSIGTALKMFEIDCGRYPTTEEGLRALIEQPPGVNGWKHGYLEAGFDLKDPWGRDYVYRCPSQKDPDSYDLISCGSSGQLGAEDNIDNWTKK